MRDEVRVTTNLTVTIGRMEFNCTADWTVAPGEPDSWDTPGIDASVDYVDGVTCNEVEWYRGLDGPDEDWGYSRLDDRPGCKAIAERWCLAELRGGAYDSELFEDADWPEDDGYDE